MLSLFVALQTFFASRISNERGATAVEYGLIISLIAAVIIVAVGVLGKDINGAFKAVHDSFNG